MNPYYSKCGILCIRHFVLFSIDLKIRRVEIAGIVPRSNEEGMSQAVRNLTDIEDGFLNGSPYLIDDPRTPNNINRGGEYHER